MDQYFMIYAGDKGEGRVLVGTDRQILHSLALDEEGHLIDAPMGPDDEVPREIMDWHKRVLIIKGEVVEPVREWALP